MRLRRVLRISIELRSVQVLKLYLVPVGLPCCTLEAAPLQNAKSSNRFWLEMDLRIGSGDLAHAIGVPRGYLSAYSDRNSSLSHVGDVPSTDAGL